MDKDSERKISDDELDAILSGEAASSDKTRSDEFELDVVDQESAYQDKGKHVFPEKVARKQPLNSEIWATYGDMPLRTGFVCAYLVVMTISFSWSFIRNVEIYSYSARIREVVSIWSVMIPLFEAVLTFLACVSLVSGKKWGWWAVVVYFCLCNISAIIVFSAGFYRQYLLLLAPNAYAYATFVILYRLIVVAQFVSLLVMFTDRTLEYFGFTKFATAKET